MTHDEMKKSEAGQVTVIVVGSLQEGVTSVVGPFSDWATAHDYADLHHEQLDDDGFKSVICMECQEPEADDDPVAAPRSKGF